MASLLVVVLSQPRHLPEVVQAWQAIGVPGITILRSAGASRSRSWLSWLGLGEPETAVNESALTQSVLLAAFEEDDLLDRARSEAERVVGGFDRPDSGLLLVLPVRAAAGLRTRQSPRPAPRPAPGGACLTRSITRDMTVEAAAHVLDLAPTLVARETPLDAVARQMVAQPYVHVACVVDEEGRLLGLIDIQSLADDLFYRLLPEEFLAEVSDLEEALAFADRSRARTAQDAMAPPAWVRQGQTVADAFRVMHERRCSGVPVVDELRRVVGYVSLLELLAACISVPGDRQAEPAGSP